MTAIEARGLAKRFGQVQAVEGLSFEVERGRVTGFLGSNGAGKTTTLRMLLGLVTPDAGTATIDGRAYADLDEPPHTVGAVLEASGFHPGRTARNHLRIQAMAARTDVSRVDDVLALVDLEGAADRRVGGFSLGMRQRLSLATALLADPDILILDEPANGMDPQGVRWLRDLLRGMAAEGAAVLVSSHLLAEVAQTVDEVIIIDHGRLIAQAPLGDLPAGPDREGSLEEAFLRLTAGNRGAGNGAVASREEDPMITDVRIELLKLRTTRLGYLLAAIPAVLTAGFSVLEASRAGTGSGRPASLDTPSGLDSVITAGIWFLIFAAVLGVTITSGEFRHQAATATYLAQPRRGRVLAAKAIAAALAGAAFGLLGYLIALGAGLGFVAARGYPVPIGDATLARYGAGHVLAAALLAAAGAGVGALARSQLAGVIGVFVWAIIVESVLGGLFTSARPYLPYTAATTLGGAQLGGAAFGPAHGVAGGGPLPFAAAAALLAVLAAVLCAVAARTTVRRDVL